VNRQMPHRWTYRQRILPSIVLVALLALPSLGTGPALAAPKRLTQVTVKDFGTRLVVGIVSTGQVLFHVTEIASPAPPRVAIDLLDTVVDEKIRATTEVRRGNVLRVRVGQFQDSPAIARVVTDRLVRPVYQPIVDLATGEVIGFEGLSRPTAESGFADPGSMFTAAEAVGRTVELDLACLHAVVAGARQMPVEQMLTVNISPRTVEAPHFSADALMALLARYSIAPERVVVELTEREKVEDVNRLQVNLGALQRFGLRIAADDVGAGNAGLRLLSQMRFDIVKIDLSLVQDGTERDTSRAVLRSLRELAGRWHASVIAEGIETVSQLRMVRELGIGAGQGYLLARPMTAPMVWS